MAKNMCLTAIAVMILISISSFSSFKIAGLTVVFGIVFFFVNRAREKEISTQHELALKDVSRYLKDYANWVWLLVPLAMNMISLTLAILFFPEFIKHIYSRTAFVASLDYLLLLVLQLAILALGEEIAWRGFFQKQLSKWLPIIPAIIFTSLIFSIGHFTIGRFGIVSYDLFFIFINSILYGVIFHKTNNVWMSAISHFIANLSAIIFILFFI